MSDLARIATTTVETPGDQIARLIRSGYLIPVQVFGNCGHPVTNEREGVYLGGQTFTCEQDEHWSYGLSDRVSTYAPAGSDCNRASFFVLRPSDELMTADPAVRAALREVLEYPDEDLS
jgi:hypothetical protein